MKVPTPFKPNAAMQIMMACGFDASRFGLHDRGRTGHTTKSGPGREHIQGDGTGKHKTTKQKRAGMFGKGIRKAITAKQKAVLP